MVLSPCTRVWVNNRTTTDRYLRIQQSLSNRSFPTKPYLRSLSHGAFPREHLKRNLSNGATPTEPLEQRRANRAFQIQAPPTMFGTGAFPDRPSRTKPFRHSLAREAFLQSFSSRALPKKPFRQSLSNRAFPTEPFPKSLTNRAFPKEPFLHSFSCRAFLTEPSNQSLTRTLLAEASQRSLSIRAFTTKLPQQNLSDGSNPEIAGIVLIFDRSRRFLAVSLVPS